MGALPARPQQIVSRILAELEVDNEGPSRAYFGAPSIRIPVDWGDPLEPWELKMLLGEVLGGHDFGRTEKLAWEYPIRFRSVPLTMAFQKFGVRAYVDPVVGQESEARALVKALLDTCHKAMPLIRKTALRSIADQQISDGKVNIDNHFSDLRDQYEHFCLLARASDEAAATAKPIEQRGDGWVGITLPAHQLRREARFEATAAVASFFSMLEHLLLIAYFFSPLDESDGSLADFIGGGWSTKFRRVLAISDPAIKAPYDALVEIADSVRNPSAHGAVRPDGTDFRFLLPGVGPVSARVTISNSKARRYSWDDKKPFPSLAALDSAYESLRSGPLRAAVTYGDSGLDLYFGSKIRDALRSAASHPEELDNLIEFLQEQVDRAANMDW